MWRRPAKDGPSFAKCALKNGNNNNCQVIYGYDCSLSSQFNFTLQPLTSKRSSSSNNNNIFVLFETSHKIFGEKREEEEVTIQIVAGKWMPISCHWIH